MTLELDTSETALTLCLDSADHFLACVALAGALLLGDKNPILER